MKARKLMMGYTAVLSLGLFFLIPAVSSKSFGLFAQSSQGNTISGSIFGYERLPLGDVTVELLDNFSRTIHRTRTNSSGRYTFAGIPQGNYVVRVLPYGTDYEEQEQSREIVNFTRQNPMTGAVSVSGFSHEQMDFYLKLRRGASNVITGTLFVQDVPPEAKKLYEKGIENLNSKKEKEGLEALRAALEIFPSYYLALERLGTEYVQKGSSGVQYLEAAYVLLDKAVEINPRGYQSWYGLAYALDSLKRNDTALTAIQKALEIAPNSTNALFLEGVLLKKNNRFEEAEKSLLKAKASSTGAMPQLHWELALLYAHNLKRYKDAAKELKLFLKASPDHKEAEKIKNLIKEYENKSDNS